MFKGSVDERDAAKILLGMPATIRVGSLPDDAIMGTVSRVALQSDRENAAQGVASGLSQDTTPFNVGFAVEITNLQAEKNIVLRSGYSASELCLNCP